MTSRDSTKPDDYNRVFGTDAFFVFFNKLEIDSYILKSDTPGKSGRDLSGKFSTAWRDDEWSVAGEYNTVQDNFDPQVGFVRRKDATQLSGDLNWQPRFRRSRTVRNLIFQTSADHITDSDGNLETRTQGFNSGIAFVNGASVNFRIDRTFERLTEVFRIRPTVPIPAWRLPVRQLHGKFQHQSGKAAGRQRELHRGRVLGWASQVVRRRD